MINGIVNIYKEKGYTSFDVVAKLRGIFHQRKIGHTGTLDPDAVGVLPVCLGNATKICEFLTDKSKEYEAELLLGIETDTQDITGNVIRECEVCLNEEDVQRAVMSFAGEYMQIPPMYSALKMGGRKLCDLAREGITVERKPRPVTIYRLEILDMPLPVVRMRVLCSKGTYIRTLCQDIGERLGCGGCMKSLVRTRVAEFCLSEALTLSEVKTLVEDGRMDFVRPVESVFLSYPSVTAIGTAEKLIENGNRIPSRFICCGAGGDGQAVRLYDAEKHFIGIYRYEDASEEYKPIKLFFDR